MEGKSGAEAAHAAAEVLEKETLRQEEQEAAKEAQRPASSSDDAAAADAATKEARNSESGSSSDGNAKDLRQLDSRIIKVPDGKVGDDVLDHLPEHERDIIKRQIDITPVSVTYRTLYRYATVNDLIIIAISAICAIAGGAALPLMTVVFGNLTGTFQQFFNHIITGSEFSHQLGSTTVYFVYLGIAEFVTIYICTLGFIYTGEHMTQKIREEYLAAILRQNVGYFDKLGAGEITTRITADTNLIQDAISEKVGLTLTAVATFITAFIIGFVKYWALTLILCSTIVAIVVIGTIGSRFIVSYSKQNINSYAVGGTIAEEVISSIRNAVAFGTQSKLADQYKLHLDEAQKWGTKQKCVLAVMISCMFWVIYANYGLAYWQGSRFLVQGDVGLNAIVTISMSIIIGAFALSNVGPNLQAFTTGVAAASKIFTTIDRPSPLNPDSDEGEKLENVKGEIELRGIKHIYPMRAEVVVMRDVNLFVPAGKTTALVGASGSGKSTVVGLVERFYDPVGGDVLLDGHNVRDLNLRWLRHQISLVSQEPTLFSTTIEGNIRHGLIGSRFESMDEEKKKELVIEAAKKANAHDFIVQLPEGYETNVGERGFLMSGGQKQRIAIARAIVSDPKILLLDEATSALDTKSEGVVQAALDKAAEGRTTIVIAHRLSTIKGADNIVVMANGRIIEQGTHDDLLERKSAYARLVEAQQISAKQEEKRAEEEAEIDETHNELIRQATTRSQHSDGASEKRVDMKRTGTQQSLSSLALRKGGKERGDQYSLLTLIKLILSFNRQEPWIMLVGLIGSILCGAGNPVSAVFLAECITSISVLPAQYGKLRTDIDFWSLMFFMLAWVMLISYMIQGVAFAICSERLISRARDRAFRTILRQDIKFFDLDANTAGALTSFLSTETTYVAGLSGATLGTLLIVLTTLIGSLTVGIAFGWKLGLVCTSTVPVMLSSGFLRFWILARFQARSKAAYEKSASYACEATSAIRTVASLARERDVWQHYHEQLEIQAKISLRSVAKSSLLYAFSQGAMFLCTALGFWYGGTLIGNHEYGMFQFFVCFSTVIFGAQSAGTFFAFAPDMGKAKQAAQEMKTLFDRQPEIDTWSNEGARAPAIEGHIEFRDVHFRYPSRPEQAVLRGLNLSVRPGQYIALVGASGCGKSTTIQLLERFYDPLAGGIFVDNTEISSLNVNDYRRFLALVSQEPTLYQGTVRENILLGADGPEADVTDDMVVKACKDANIYDFIMSLPDGFNTVVGSKGSMLSGGQKQRVAIARALIRDPKILLLDEATSALDSESEKVVQAALDAAAQGRTTIAVAHRLSTIQKADIIYVFDQGRIVEQGNHQELINLKGKYFELVNLQSLGKAH